MGAMLFTGRPSGKSIAGMARSYRCSGNVMDNGPLLQALR
jgi:hypothetical protein